MRVFVYLQDFPPDTDAPQLGIAKAVYGLSRGLAAEGCDVVILCEGKADCRKVISSRCEVRCFRRSERLHPMFAPVSAELEEFVLQNSEDSLFVLNGIFHLATYAMSRLLHRHGLPYVVAPHDPYHPTIFTKNAHKKWPYWYLRERRMLREAAAIQVLDIRHRQWLPRLGVNTPVIESTNGYAPEDVLPESALKWNESGPVSALFIGRIDSHNKGLDILLTALRRIPAVDRPSLTIQGPDWGDRAALRAQAQRLHLNVQFPEADFNTPSAAIMAQHDIFCLPSRFEGFGLAALEAMLSARVLLVSDIAGIAPHVRASGCGIVVDASPKSIQQGFLELLRLRSEWKEMGLAGRQYALENLRWEKIARDTIRHYRKLLKPVMETTRTQAPVSAV